MPPPSTINRPSFTTHNQPPDISNINRQPPTSHHSSPIIQYPQHISGHYTPLPINNTYPTINNHQSPTITYNTPNVTYHHRYHTLLLFHPHTLSNIHHRHHTLTTTNSHTIPVTDHTPSIMTNIPLPNDAHTQSCIHHKQPLTTHRKSTHTMGDTRCVFDC